MDKRTFFFFISLTLALFGVNLYFQGQSSSELKKWAQDQQEKLELQSKTLTEEIQKESVPLKNLPLVDVYSAETGGELLVTGVLSGDALIAQTSQKTVYVRPFGTEEPLKQAQLITSQGTPYFSLYSLKEGGTLLIGDLPTFGQYDLQLLMPKPAIATPADYLDGHFSPLQEKLNQVKTRLNQKKDFVVQSGLVLMKGDTGYLPVGVFDADSKVFIALDDLKNLHPFLKKAMASKTQAPEETFYVLENDTLQLVFSTKGGALKEINLPLKSKDDEKSVVKPVENDRIILEKYPQNAYFPAHPYITLKEGKQVEEARGKLGGYTPLTRRDLSDKNLLLNTTAPYYALNIVSEYPEVAELPYKVTQFEKDKIVFEADQGFRKITKTFSFPKEEAPYVIDLAINIEGNNKNLKLTSGVPEVELVSGSPQPTLKLRTKQNGKGIVEELKLPQSETTALSASLDWIATSNGFFAIVVNPLNQTETGYKTLNVPGNVSPSRLVQLNDTTPDTYPGYMALLPLKGKGPYHYRIFAGPLSENILTQVDTLYTDPKTGDNPNYISIKSYYGWFAFISEPFSKFLYIILNLFHSITGSWGLSIILLTVVLRIILYPLNAWSAKSTLKMQELSAKSQALQEKYKNDQKRYQLEMMNLYRETGANPFSGCLISTVIQIPFLLGMFGLLKTSFSLRGASFIPGWIDDLSAPDVLFSWETPIWLIGNQFHLLPFLLGAVMFLQQRFLTPGPSDVNQMTEQQRQARATGSMMAVMFVFIFYNFPSGLNLYWLSSTLLGALQQAYMKKQMTKT